MLKLKTFIETTGLSETAPLVLHARRNDGNDDWYSFPKDIDLDLRDAETGKASEVFLTPFMLKFAHTEKSEALLKLRVWYWCVDRGCGCLDVYLTK